MLHPSRIARCAFLLIACGAVPAAGQTDYRNLDEGRPLRTEDALPVDHYGFELTLPYELEARDGARLHLATPELAYGVIRGGEVGFAVPLAAFDREPGTTWALAGARIFALQNLLRERPGRPPFALRADLDLPLGGLGGDETVVSLKAIATRNWGALRLHANASVSSSGDEAGPRAEPQWSAGVALTGPRSARAGGTPSRPRSGGPWRTTWVAWPRWAGRR